MTKKKCKECGKIEDKLVLDLCNTCYYRDYRKRNPNKDAEYRKRHKEVINAKSKVYYRKNKHWLNKYHTKYQKKKYRENPAFKELILFRQRTVKLIPLDGRSCINCGSIDNLHRHHLNYKDPTQVVILCRKCHTLVHRELRKVRD